MCKIVNSNISEVPDVIWSEHSFSKYPELKTLEWDILNPDRLINLEINNKRRTSIINLEIKKKSGSSLNPDIHHLKVPSSGWFIRPNLPMNAETCNNLNELTLDPWFRWYIPRFRWKLLGLDDKNLGSYDKLLGTDD